MAEGCEDGFNRVADAYTLPVLRRKVVKLQQLIAVLVQTQRDLRIFRFIRGNEQIKSLVRISLRFHLPNSVQGLFGFHLCRFRQTGESQTGSA